MVGDSNREKNGLWNCLHVHNTHHKCKKHLSTIEHCSYLKIFRTHSRFCPQYHCHSLHHLPLLLHFYCFMLQSIAQKAVWLIIPAYYCHHNISVCQLCSDSLLLLALNLNKATFVKQSFSIRPSFPHFHLLSSLICPLLIISYACHGLTLWLHNVHAIVYFLNVCDYFTCSISVSLPTGLEALFEEPMPSTTILDS